MEISRLSCSVMRRSRLSRGAGAVPAIRYGLLAVLALGALPACKTQRTVLAGPTVTGLEAQGESGSSRFSNQDPSGYLMNGKEGDTVRGLNAMSGKMYSGELAAQSQKEFNTSKNYLTREYAGQKNFGEKAWKGAPEGRRWTDRLFDTDSSPEGSMIYADADRQAAVKDSPEASRMAAVKDYADGTRTARTGNYRPAERAMENGRDVPQMSDARPDNLTASERLVRDRIAKSEASAADINKFLGKP